MAGEAKASGTRSRSRAAAQPEEVPAAEALKTIPAKLAHVRAQVEQVAKDSYNPQSGGYHYASWGNVLQAVRGHLDDVGLHLHLSVAGVRDMGQGVALVELDYEWHDTKTGETLGGRWAGTGWDRGDKALYKAYSGALKYLVLDTFLIPTGDDPEAGEQAPEGGGGAPARQGSPRIPRERAERIVAAAQQVPGMTEAVFQAKLADLGVSRVVDLTVDAAETLEAFIAAEKAQGASS